MTQKDKQLLLKDLCARLPYNVKVDITYSKEHGSSTRLRICSEGCLILNTDVLGLYIEDEIYLKPYLRPLSSMTEEEDKEYAEVIVKSQDCSFENSESATTMANDWLLSKGFDVRGLISKDLALEALEGMYND